MEKLPTVWASALLFATACYASSITYRQNPGTYGAGHSGQNCCSNLKGQLHDKVLVAGIDNITASIEPYWSPQTQEQTPACVVLPTTAEDVSIAVRVALSGLQNSLDHCEIAVRSGGHAPGARINNINGGITIDLSKLNIVEPNEFGTITKVGPGNRWSAVYEVLDPLNLTVLGGRSKAVGVGGLLMSAGMSFFSPRYGLPCDNVINFELVMPNATIVNANASSHPHLHKALKGGSIHFGIVTRLDLFTFSQTKFYGGMGMYNASSLPELFPILTDFANSTAGYNDFSQLTLLYGNYEGQSLAMTHQHFTGGPFPPPAGVFDALEPFQTSNTLRVDSLTNFTVELEAVADTSRKAFATVTFKNQIAMPPAFFTLANETMTKLADVPGLLFIISHQPFGPFIHEKSALRGGNLLGLNDENEQEKDRILIALTVSWKEEKDDDRMYSAIRELIESGTAKAREIGAWDRYIFQNYAASWQDVYAGVGDENREEYRRVKKEVDRDGLWERALPGAFEM